MKDTRQWKGVPCFYTDLALSGKWLHNLAGKEKKTSFKHS